MTVGAAPVEVLDGTEWLRLCGVTTAVVAGVANAGHPDFEELRVVRAMRFMAIRAVLKDRWVLPEKRAAAFGVATETILVDAALDELAGIGRSMWIVAARAGDLPLAIGHMGRSLQLRAAHGMALQAELRLGLFDAFIFRKRGAVPGIGGERLVNFLFDLVAINASETAGLMRATLPEQMSSPRMALLASCILLGD